MGDAAVFGIETDDPTEFFYAQTDSSSRWAPPEILDLELNVVIGAGEDLGPARVGDYPPVVVMARF